MSLQNAASQLLEVQENQIRLEKRVKEFENTLKSLEKNVWQLHFKKELAEIQNKVDEMEKEYKQKEELNETLKKRELGIIRKQMLKQRQRKMKIKSKTDKTS